MRLFGLEKDGPFAVARHAMNLALVARGDKEIALAVERHAPDIFLARIVEQPRLAVRRNFVNLSVGVGGGVNVIVRIHDDRVDLETFQFGKGTALARGIQYKELCRSAA